MSFLNQLQNLAIGVRKKNQQDLLRPVVEKPQPQTQAQTQPQVPNLDQRKNNIREFYKSQLGPQDPNRQDIDNYYPILQNYDYLQEKENRYNRPGLSELLALQSFYESTGGRTGNPFGAKPNGNNANFPNIKSAIDYQTSPNVLGGGVNNNLNILNKSGVITPEEIEKLYTSYDPPGAYVDNIVEKYKEIFYNNYVR